MRNAIVYLFITLGVSSCSTLSSNLKNVQNGLNQLAQDMSGTFSSRAQSQMDSNYYDINLVMYPIWENQKNVKWLYVEQAVTASIKKPYRQRVYKLMQTPEKGEFVSIVYLLKSPEKYIHAWERPEIFNTIYETDLELREGCEVYLKPAQNNSFKGSTQENNCHSTLRGASYATSKVEITKDRIISWDQGWNDKGEQVWGATGGGYFFDRIEPMFEQ